MWNRENDAEFIKILTKLEDLLIGVLTGEHYILKWKGRWARGGGEVQGNFIIGANRGKIETTPPLPSILYPY